MSTTAIPANHEFTSVIFNNAAIREDGRSMPLTFERIYAPAIFVESVDLDMNKDTPPQPRTTVASKQQLIATLGSHIGSGHAGVVFAIDGPTIQDGAGAQVNGTPSPMVAKFAARCRSKFVAREAWFYDELASLQGIVLPRFFGWYTAELPDGWKLSAWETDDKERKRMDSPRDPDAENDKGWLRYYGKFTESASPLIARLQGPRCVSVLVLERCGEPFLPIRKAIPAQVEADVYDALEDMARLGIEHGDIRYTNILTAPASPPGLPGLPSPHYKRVYGCRIIDLEMSRKTNFTLKYHKFSCGGWLRRLLRNLPHGYIIGQNED